jgi:hypothetical protein
MRESVYRTSRRLALLFGAILGLAAAVASCGAMGGR